MPKFFSNNISDGKITITGDDARHISKVLRMKEGDCITVGDMCNTDYTCKIANISKAEVVLDILASQLSDTENAVKISVFQALPKASKMEYIIQKCVELGAHEIIPCATKHCVVKLDTDSDKQKKVQRWQSISEAAAKQSMRSIIPKVNIPLDFKSAMETLKNYDVCFICHENEQKTTLKSFLQKAKDEKQINSVAFFVGPEGGISDEETQYIKDNNIACVTLGKRILRTETASTAVISMLNYEFNE